MPDLATAADLQSVPKVELHVHLNGAIAESTAAELARRHGEDPASALRLVDGRYPGAYPDFGGFLDAYMATNQFLRTPDDLELVAADFVRGQAAQGIAYTEAIFTAMIVVRNGMEPRAMWAALRRGLTAAGPETRVNLIIDAIRDLGRPDAEATLRLVEAADAPIVGLCLTGVEGTVPTTDFVEFRAGARRLGLGFEAHAGEMGPPSGIVDALDILEADRIGHGVAAIHDEAVFDRLVREQVVLDVCPSSNVGIGEFPSLAAHPMIPFWRAGMNMTISSDDPPFFRTTLTEELGHLARLAELSRADLAMLQRRAATAAFLPAAAKAALVAAVDAWDVEVAGAG